MRLRALEATFLKIVDERTFEEVGDRLDGAQGVMFLCPKCFAANGGAVGTHPVICWFVGVPQTFSPQPGRWQPAGSSLDDLSFAGPGGASVLLTSGCGWHGFVTNGDAT